MNRYKTVASVTLAAALHFSAAAAPKELPLRWTPGIPIHEGMTTWTVATQYGTNLAVLPISGTVTYDFFSSPLVSPCALSAHDKCGGRMFLRNRSQSGANDFTVTGRIQFFDYDPLTGTESLIVDTGTSHPKDVRAGNLVNLSLPKVKVGADTTIPAGRLLHLAVTVAVVSGSPEDYGRLLYDGPRGRSSAAFLAEDTNLTFNFAEPAWTGQPANSIQILANGSAQITCSGAPNQNYVIEATTDLTSPWWTTIGTNTTGANGLCVFIDNDAPNFPARYYRTVSR